MTDLDEIKLAKLAREMAMNIRNYKDIFADFDITEEDYYEIAKNSFYKKIKDQFTTEWNSTLSTEDRVRIGSLAYYEQLIPEITRRALDANEPLPAATEVGKLLAKTAGIGDPKVEKNTSERFVITINLGADTEGKEVIEHYNKSIAVDPNDIEVDAKLSRDIKARTKTIIKSNNT
jgi:hypothetical protein